MATVITSLHSQLRRVTLPIVRRLNELLGGDYSSLLLGNGFEFSHMKEYVPGDDVRRINWRALARDPYHPRVNVTHPDSSPVGWVIADCGPDMNFGSIQARKSQVALEAAAVFGHLLTQRGNRYAAILLGNQQMEVVSPSRRRQQVTTVAGRQHLTESPDGEPVNLTQALKRFRTLQRRRSVCVVISDFRRPGWERELKLIAHHHTAFAIQVADPLELGMSGDFGVMSFRSPGSRRFFRGDITAKVSQRYTDLAKERQDKIRTDILATGARLIELHTDGDWLANLILALKQPKRRTYVRN